MIFSKSNQLGSSLVETMVSLLLMGVGLLGVLTLQAKGLNSNQRAVFVTEAQIIAQDMADRIMAFGSTDSNAISNAVASSGFYNGISIAKGNELVESSCSVASPCNSNADIRAYDANEWLRLMRNSSLPRARATVSWASQVYSIRVMWDQERIGEGEVECGTDNCFTMEVRLP